LVTLVTIVLIFFFLKNLEEKAMSGSNWLKPQAPPPPTESSRKHVMGLGVLLTSEGQKLHPQVMLMKAFSDQATYEEP
jgi:hypothetical protein